MTKSDNTMTSKSNTDSQGKILPTVSAAQVVDVVQSLHQAGVSAETIAEKSGIQSGHLTGVDSRIPGSNARKLWELLLETSGDAMCGFRIGTLVRTEAMGVLGNLVLASPNFEVAFKRLLRFYGLLTEVESAKMSEYDKQTMIYSFHCLQPEYWCMPMLDRGLTAAVAWARAFAGYPLQIKAIHLKRPESNHAKNIRSFFDCPVKFSQAQDGVLFAKELLKIESVNQNDYLGRILESRALKLHSELDSQTSLEKKIRDELTYLLPEGESKIELVADALGLSPSKLYRELRRQDLTYTQLLDEQRFSLSRYYLGECNYSKTETALLLGYSELSAYLRAERRWQST